MFTHEEIRQITFEKAMRGYRAEDVESFMEKIADEFEALEKEKQDTEEKLFILAEKVEQYKSEEESIKVTLINAQRLGASIVSDAQIKADTLLREATIKKNDILSSAYSEIDGNEEVLKRLKREVSEFKRTILSLYKDHIESLSRLPEDKAEVKEPVVQETQEFEIAKEAPIQEQTEVAESECAPEVEVQKAPEEEVKFKSISSLFEE
ncbi:MAG: DivIVA domain-containing protein [Oscillospiraceae bacterium]